MSRHDDGLATLMEVLEEMHDLGCIGSIEITRRLIADDDARIMDQSSSNTGTLNLTTRERLYTFFFFGKESYL